jgi:hypothetical protein
MELDSIGLSLRESDKFLTNWVDHRSCVAILRQGMSRPLCQASLRSYFAHPEGAAYMRSDLLVKRLAQLMKRVAAGERFTTSQAAELLHLPVEVFRCVWAAVPSAEGDETVSTSNNHVLGGGRRQGVG